MTSDRNPPSVSARADADAPVTAMTAHRSPPWWRALRPRQWAKSVLVASAPVAAGRLFEWDVMWRAAAAFIVFSAAASATYLLNDAADVERDKKHPLKRTRPIAAGELPVSTARWMAAGLMVSSLLGAVLLDGRFALVVAIYLGTTMSYSAGLKRVPILEMVLVSAGFTLRAIGGGFATHVRLSWWFVTVVSGGALLLVAGKRLGEFKAPHGSDQTRSVLAKYNEALLQTVAFIAAAITLLGYVLWAFNQSQNPDRQGWLIWLTLVPFVAALERYRRLAMRGETEEPDRLVFVDRPIAVLGLCWLALYVLAISL